MGSALPSLGIRRIEAIHYYVRDLERSRGFYTEKLDFSEVARSSEDLAARGRQDAIVFEAGACRVICSSPRGEGGRAHRYLQKHPDGVGSVLFEVEDIDRTFALLEERGGTPVHDVRTTEGPGGKYRTFLVTTPFGDTTFRFVQRDGAFSLYPGFERRVGPPGGGNASGFTAFDHVTSNFETMAPALLWMEHVLGFERFWEIAFHTDDVSRRVDEHGSGLRSVVMYDRASGVKFANNEPSRPNFTASQINVFHEEHRGDGVQHVALGVKDIVSAVRGLRARGVAFMPTPGAYYDRLPARLASLGVGALEEPADDLRSLGILVDSEGPGRYLLQIFLKDSAAAHASPEAGPFFYEIIQR
ncbi:MAG: 4-hydroxyphenylpyruvate dioxygenase family protein, partial [Polyangiaceae bacterium]